MDEEPIDLIPEEYYYSMSRDVSENERNHKTFTWWELLVYLTVLMMAFAITATR